MAFAGLATSATLAELSQARHKLLVQMAEEDPNHPLTALTQHFKNLQILPATAHEENTVALLAATQEPADFFESLGHPIYTSADLIKEGQDLILQAYPNDIKGESSDQVDYFVPLDSLFPAYFKLVRKLMVANLYTRVHTILNVAGKSDLSLAPSAEVNEFYRALHGQVTKYAQFYDKDLFYIGEDKKKHYNGAKLASDKLNKIWEGVHNSLFTGSIQELHNINNFLINGQVYYYKENQYLIAAAQAATQANAGALRNQLIQATSVLIALTKTKFAKLKESDLINFWKSAIVELNTAAQGDHEDRPLSSAEIVQAIIDVVEDDISEDTADLLNNYRSAVKEMSKGKVGSETSYEVVNTNDGAQRVSTMPLNMNLYANMQTIFRDTLLPHEYDQFYITLNKAVKEFTDAAKEFIKKDDLAREFNAFLDANYVKDKFYIILKIHSLNMLQNAGFPIKFDNVSEDVENETAIMLSDKNFDYYRGAIDQAYTKLIREEGNYPADPIGRFRRVNRVIQKSKEDVNSEIFRVVTWKSQLII